MNYVFHKLPNQNTLELDMEGRKEGRKEKKRKQREIKSWPSIVSLANQISGIQFYLVYFIWLYVNNKQQAAALNTEVSILVLTF